jgi:hypothetical protein
VKQIPRVKQSEWRVEKAEASKHWCVDEKAERQRENICCETVTGEAPTFYEHDQRIGPIAAGLATLLEIGDHVWEGSMEAVDASREHQTGESDAAEKPESATSHGRGLFRFSLPDHLILVAGDLTNQSPLDPIACVVVAARLVQTSQKTNLRGRECPVAWQ